jgi:hypothetical protein
MNVKDLGELREKLRGYTFTVENDPDIPEFFSVYADRDGAGAEVAGKIGERCVAEIIAATLNQLCDHDHLAVNPVVAGRLAKHTKGLLSVYIID